MTYLQPWHPNKAGQLHAITAVQKPTLIDAFRDIGLPSLEIWPGVFDPATSFSGKFLARVLSDNKSLYAGAEVLDMACGSGILGLVCARHGAKSVTCTDISATASANALHNSTLLGLTIKATHGDLFGPLESLSKFDLIVFNPPGFEGTANSEVEAHYVCPYAVIDAFYASAPKFLAKGGTIISATSDLHDAARSPLTMARKYNYAYELIAVADSDRGQQYAFRIQPHLA